MIFNLFKSKPNLKELIPEGFVDIHSHILPGIDDGAKDIKESMVLISEMKKMGFSKIIGTPHTYEGIYNNTIETISNSYYFLKKNMNLNIEIEYASEYMIDESLINKIENKEILTIKDKYVLIEMSFISKPINLYEIIYKLMLHDYIPVLAHPERYRFLFNDFKNFKKLKNAGCKFQINLFSLIGYYGNDIYKMSEELIKNNMIDYCGSDIHSTNQLKLFEKKVKIKNFKKISKITENNMIFN